MLRLQLNTEVTSGDLRTDRTDVHTVPIFFMEIFFKAGKNIVELNAIASCLYDAGPCFEGHFREIP